MNEISIQNNDIENKLAEAGAQLSQLAEKPPREDLLKQMGESLQAQVRQMSQLAVKLFGG